MSPSNSSPLRTLSIIEARTITGVAKALLAFYKTGRAQGLLDVSIATFVREGAASNVFIDTVRDLGFPLYTIPESGPFDLRARTALRDLIYKLRPAVVETQAVKSHTLLATMRLPRGTQWVAFHHGYTTQDLKMRVYNRVNPWALRRAGRVITVCDAFAKALAAQGVRNATVVPNAIEPFMLPEPPNTNTIVSIGRLSSEKGHRFLVDAAAKLKSEFHLIIVGDGPERAALEQQTAALGLTGKVEFVGHQNDPLTWYAKADVFVLPSLSEGSPLALLEAMMARRAVVATHVGGIPEALTDGENALLAAPGDAKPLAAAIERMLANAELRSRLRDAAYHDVITRNAPETYTQRLLSIYNSGKNASMLK